MEHRYPVALVTGGARGIGFATSEALARASMTVVLTARRLEQAEVAADRLRHDGLHVIPWELDVADHESVKNCAANLPDEVGAVDVLINNAGVSLDWNGNVFMLEESVLMDTLAVNLLGVLWMCQAFVPPMMDRGYDHVVNVSPDSGQLASMGAISPAYSISKAAVNAVTRIMAAAAGPSVKVNSIHPGWVSTDMGGPEAPTNPNDAASYVLKLATLPQHGPTGGFFFQGEVFAW